MPAGKQCLNQVRGFVLSSTFGSEVVIQLKSRWKPVEAMMTSNSRERVEYALGSAAAPFFPPEPNTCQSILRKTFQVHMFVESHLYEKSGWCKLEK